MKLYTGKYIKQIRELHQSSKAFGSAPTEFFILESFIREYQVNSVLDYGCGKGSLVNKLQENYPELKIQGYDPGIKKYLNLPKEAELVSSTDVLEHIEPEFIDSVLKHIHELSKKITYLEIACLPAGRILPDGRNAHLIQESPEWWKIKLLMYWKESEIISFDVEFLNEKPERITVLLCKLF